MGSIHPQKTNGLFSIYHLSRKRYEFTFSVFHNCYSISSFTHPNQCWKTLKQFLLMPGRSLYINNERPLQILSVDQRCHDLNMQFLTTVLCIFNIRIKFCTISKGILYFDFFCAFRKLLTFRKTYFFHRGQYFFHSLFSCMYILIYKLFHISDFKLSYHVVLLITTSNTLPANCPLIFSINCLFIHVQFCCKVYPIKNIYKRKVKQVFVTAKYTVTDQILFTFRERNFSSWQTQMYRQQQTTGSLLLPFSFLL